MNDAGDRHAQPCVHVARHGERTREEPDHGQLKRRHVLARGGRTPGGPECDIPTMNINRATPARAAASATASSSATAASVSREGRCLSAPVPSSSSPSVTDRPPKRRRSPPKPFRVLSHQPTARLHHGGDDSARPGTQRLGFRLRGPTRTFAVSYGASWAGGAVLQEDRDAQSGSAIGQVGGVDSRWQTRCGGG